MSVRLFESLGFRLLAPLFVTVSVVLACYAVVTFRSTDEHMQRMVRTDMDRSSELIQRATHDGMLLNRKVDVQATIKRLAHSPDIAAIRIYDKLGKIVLSANEAEIGQQLPLDAGTCRTCHPDGRRRGEAVLKRSGSVHVDDRPGVLRHLSIIENEPSCSTAACHAHPADQRVLGVLDLEMSTASLDSAMQAAKRHLLWATLGLAAILIAVMGVFVRRVLQRPIAEIFAGTRRVAEGDLDTCIQIHGRDELAELGEAFNQMAHDLKAARQELFQWSQRLEAKVREKTEELQLAQREVLHMERMVSLGKLSATVAHEINNPLSGMLAYAQLTRRELQEQPLDKDVCEQLTQNLRLIESECSRCGAIVQNLLLFARRSGAAKTAVDLNEVVQQSLMVVRHHLEVKDVFLHCELLEGDPEIVADAGQLRQALVALLVNAVEAIQGPGGGRGVVTVALRGDAAEVEIEISDTGVGIPPDIRPHIFEPFFSTKEATTGVGLGLAVVYGIVQRHGGRIDVDSTPGQGTTFRLHLPRQAPPDDAETAHEPEALFPSSPTSAPPAPPTKSPS